MTSIMPDKELIRTALACKCPRCGIGTLYRPGFLSLTIVEQCPHCGFPLGKNDSADGPAVLLIFALGTLLVPLAAAFEFIFSPPLWAHIVLWGPLALAMTLGALRPLKAYVIALQYKHRPQTMRDDTRDHERQ
jgi:uncharacterized protein (DUF983 family)